MRALRWIQAYVALGGLYVGAIVYLSLIPHPPKLAPDWPMIDKWEHLVAYGLMMAWFGQLAVERRLRANLALGFMALGGGIELLQGAMALGRSMEFADFAADALGVWLGHAATRDAGGRLLLTLESKFKA